MPATDIVTNLDAAHLLRRVGFGPTAAEIQSLTGLTRQAAVASVMDLTSAPAVVRPSVDDRDNEWRVLRQRAGMVGRAHAHDQQSHCKRR
jgi:hypothetical protein